MDRIKKAANPVINAGAKTMLKVRLRVRSLDSVEHQSQLRFCCPAASWRQNRADWERIRGEWHGIHGNPCSRKNSVPGKRKVNGSSSLMVTKDGGH